MSGAGTFNAGTGVAGSDPVAASSATTTALTKPLAVFYDPLSQTIPMRADGTFIAIHPVDQAATFALTVKRGSIKSCPNLGHRFFTLPSLTDPRFYQQAIAEAKFALSDLIKAGDVAYRSLVTRGTPTAGRVELLIQYTNLRTKQVQTVSSANH